MYLKTGVPPILIDMFREWNPDAALTDSSIAGFEQATGAFWPREAPDLEDVPGLKQAGMTHKRFGSVVEIGWTAATETKPRPEPDAPDHYRHDASPAAGGIKHDAGKPRMSLLPRAALEAEARVMAFGERKYSSQNWRKGFEMSRLLDAALRHIYAYTEGETTDPESGLSHLAHARCCLAFAIEQEVHGTGVDDRFKRPTPTHQEKG